MGARGCGGGHAERDQRGFQAGACTRGRRPHGLNVKRSGVRRLLSRHMLGGQSRHPGLGRLPAPPVDLEPQGLVVLAGDLDPYIDALMADLRARQLAESDGR